MTINNNNNRDIQNQNQKPETTMTTTSSDSDQNKNCTPKLFKNNKSVHISIDPNKPSRGRGLFIKKQLNSKIKPGTTLLSLVPHVAVLDTSSLSSRCSCCFLEKQDFELDNPSTPSNRTIRRCGKCKVIAYCGSNCQQLDWASHKPECTALVNYAKLAEEAIKANQKSKSRSSPGGIGLKDSFGLGGDEPDNDPQTISRIPSATVRALGRLIWKKRKEEKLNPDWWTGLSELQHHLNEYNSTQKESLMQLSVTLSRYVGNQELLAVFESASALLPLCSRFIDNSFTLTSIILDQIGVVFVPSAAFINHSCNPNAVVVFPEGGEGAGSTAGKEWVKVIAIKPIEPGEEIVTSYIDSAGTRQERRNELVKRYKFVCDCQACQSDWNDQQVDPREALKCPKCTNWFSIGPKRPDGADSSNISSPAFEMSSPSSSRPDAGPSSSKRAVRKEIACPHCGFSRLIDVEGQRSAIKKSGKALDPAKEPAKAAYYAEKAMEWFQSKLSPFTFGSGFYPILDLRRMRMASYLMRPQKSNLSQATSDVQQILGGVHEIYGVGHPSSVVTRSVIAQVYGHLCASTVEAEAKPANARQISVELQLFENLRAYQAAALDEARIGFGAAHGGGRLGRSIARSIELTEREIIALRRLLQSSTS
ncbi:uncharacterized protein PGTG_11256 [Puccinia graminis f. sp. tritici CRL 75-36-700-3]|uniref:SET domain-containing protein n=1 Tax=Puccinia graminis f. sp. tritici (strain CRL 75-36-700-3 / race SCCL) TaxID=418459 RepID=E3KLB2_PUCGT|nr:uncharacterized protein PGTG_11256 [Puccinia graminis f. sp. tritici CRL 75-36-700-3]EFP85087.2 hypothetical protein PGTG_11256 [Puccinia graminis f. sp. tritici CRL 75-36-700-3]